MSEQLVNAIKNKYSVSEEVGQQVVNVLAAAEQKRQAGSAPSGMRAVSHGSTPANTGDMRGALTDVLGGLLGGQQSGQPQGGGDLLGMVGNLLGGAQASQGQGGQQSGDLLGMVENLIGGHAPQASNQGQQGGGDLLGMVGGLLGGQGGQPQGGHNVVSILADLLGNSTHGSSQGPDLNSMLNGLLGGQQGGQGSPDITSLVGSLLGGQSAPPASTAHPQGNPQKPSMGSLQDKLDQGMLAKPSKPKKSLKDNSLGNEKKKF